jgi:hypothetical protein
MYINGKMRPVETIPGMGVGEIKNYDICRPQSDHAERSDLASRFFIAGWVRGRGEREREREREREKGKGLNTLSETWHDLIVKDLMVHADWRLGQKGDSS